MSKWNIIVLSLISAILGGLVVGGVLLFFIKSSDTYQSLKPNPYGAGAGHQMLLDFQCRYGETKHVLINGIDDDFAIGGIETGRKSGQFDAYPGHTINAAYQRAYDEIGNDKVLADFFEMPTHIMRGLFVTRLEHKNDYGNDYIDLGHFGLPMANGWYKDQYIFERKIRDLSGTPGWEKHGDIYAARFKDMEIKYKDIEEVAAPYLFTNFLSYLQSVQNRKNRNASNSIEFTVAEDTGVDFSGMAVCTRPETLMGVSLAEYKAVRTISDEFILMSCNFDMSAKHCNPVYGDTSCDIELPLACIKDTGEDLDSLTKNQQDYVRIKLERHWSGGIMDFTDAVAANQFKTLAEANQYCAVQFGKEWRVMDYHDGGVSAVAGRYNSERPDGRVWVDIKDQPYGTCWARDGGEP